MYADKKEMHELIVKFQYLNDCTDSEWLVKYKNSPKNKKISGDTELLKTFIKERESFKEWKREFYAEKVKRLSNESEEDNRKRQMQLKKTKEALGSIFLKIIDGVARMPEFNNKSTDPLLKDDMKSEGLWIMYNYVNRYDSRKTNPFSYFTEMAKNAFRHSRDNYNTYQDRYKATDHLENMDKEEVGWLI